MVTVSKKVNSATGLTWLNISGSTSDVVQRLANERFTARHVVHIQYSTDGSTAIALACRRE